MEPESGVHRTPSQTRAEGDGAGEGEAGVVWKESGPEPTRQRTPAEGRRARQDEQRGRRPP